MNKVRLEYGDLGRGSFSEEFSDAKKLLMRLDEIRAEYSKVLKIPYSVAIVQSNGAHLSVGLGNGDWMVFYFPAGYPENHHESVLNSLGDENAEGTALFYFGDHTELSRKYLIPRSKALEVVRVWCEEGALSGCIRWTNQIF